MPEITAHPSPEQLSAYNLGQLPPDEAVAVESHISECEPCCDTIVSLSSDDTFVGLLKEARRLPTDQTVDHGVAASCSLCQDVPVQLAEHPRYEILGLIGKGGMGDVYKARHRKMERTVALKVINRGLVQKPEAVDRFHREVKAAAQLSHPNIVTAYDADQASDFHFMVMEYVDGVDLSQKVKQRGALPIAEACDYIRQAATGLQHAHERGMVHRDIKPHNLMATRDGTVKILDFGLASLAPVAMSEPETVAARGDLTAAGTIMGTPDFISPEQAKDARSADIRSDIYSLGATLYFLLSAQPPFAEGSVMHKLKSHAQFEPESLATLRNDMPEELVAIVSRMMAKDPNERYLTPKEVADALESFLRTWQPGAANSQGQDASSGGDDSCSGGQKPEPDDDSNPSRLPMVAKCLLYSSLLPIGLLVLNEFVPLGIFSGEIDWFLYCVLTSIALSTIGGIVAGVHQALKINRNDQRMNGMTTGQTSLIIISLAVSAFILLNHLSDGKGQDHSKSDHAALQGDWRVILAEDSGRASSQDALRDTRVSIKQDEFVMDMAGRKNVSTFKLDPSTSPKSIDLKADGRTRPGIYDLQGDTLRICVSEAADSRPTVFDSQPDSVNDVVLTLKRAKPAETVGNDNPAATHDGQLTEELARELIPRAASMSKEEFQKLQTNPSDQALESKSLSLILMTLDVRGQTPEAASDFKFLVDGYPKPSEIAAAMSPSRSKGYFSMIQPDYITECKITSATDEIAQGKVTFNAPKLYIGSVVFEAKKHKKEWRIEKFQLPTRQISIVLGEDGIWHRQEEGKD